jgi:hypothetical protein
LARLEAAGKSTLLRTRFAQTAAKRAGALLATHIVTIGMVYEEVRFGRARAGECWEW